ncbi:MAG: DMT family transporter [Calditerrivibrio sp.]|nr:DMT family transporter [Calditerrivibrio sp.]
MIVGILYCLLSAIAFGFLAILGKLGTNLGVGSLQLLTYRFVIASSLFFIFFLMKDRTLFKICLKDLMKAIFAGGVLYLLQSFFFFKALEYISASTTSLILYIYPLTVAVLSRIFFKARITSNNILSMVLIALGCGMIFYDAFARKQDIKGVAFAAGAMLVFSFYLIFVQKSLKNIRPMTFSFYVILSTAVAFSFFNNPIDIFYLNREQALVSVLIGLVPTFLAVSLLYVAIDKIGSFYASIFSTIEPVVTVTASALMLGERVVLLQITGMILILLGIIIPNIGYIVRGKVA